MLGELDGVVMPVSGVLTLPVSVLTAHDVPLGALAMPPLVTSRPWIAPIGPATVKH